MIALATLRELLALPADVPTDTVLADLLRRAIGRVQSRTGRYFGPLETVTEIIRGTKCRAWRTWRGCRSPRLYLTDIPASLDYEDAPEVMVDVFVNDEPHEPLTTFMLRIDGVEAWLERTDGGAWDMRYEYHVSYVRGYAQGNLPDDVHDFVLGWISRKLGTLGADGIASEGIGGYTYTMARDQSAGLEELESSIARWIRPVLA